MSSFGPPPSPHESVVVVTTSYPEHVDDGQGHFVGSEVRRLAETAAVTVLAPGRGRAPLGRERVVSLGGGDAFGFPGALARLEEAPWRVFGAAAFVARAEVWLRRARPSRLIAHFLLPCGAPLGTRRAAAGTDLEIVVHGSDARLFAALPRYGGRDWLAKQLARARPRLRFVSRELRELVLGGLSPLQRRTLEPLSSVEPCAVDVPSGLSRAAARAVLGVREEERLAVVVARLVPGKRVGVALEACQRLPRLRAVVVGEGPERAALEQRFPRATFVGQVERPRALTWLAAADVLVSASLREGAPTVVREARALGTPVVCLEAGDVRRWAETDPGIHVVGGPPVR